MKWALSLFSSWKIVRPLAGAGIEMIQQSIEFLFLLFAPSRGRELKCCGALRCWCCYPVRPLAGAGIEIANGH